MTEAEKQEAVEFKDDDTPEIRGIKSYWQTVLNMVPGKRRVFLQGERVKEAEQQLRRMVESNRIDDATSTEFIKQSKAHINDYEEFHDEQFLTTAELYASVARSTKQNKYTLVDIRKQRERIWQEKRRLKTLSDGPSQSSSHSKT